MPNKGKKKKKAFLKQQNQLRWNGDLILITLPPTLFFLITKNGNLILIRDF
jgi:hypothetical protein